MSGSEALDRYLRTQASQDARRDLASVFVLVSDEGTLAGFYTLSATPVGITTLPQTLSRGLPRYPMIPATLLGRLAIDQRFQRQGHGRFLLIDSLRRALRSEVASHAVLVDAKDDAASRYYEREGFLRFPDEPLRLAISMAAARRLFA